MTFIATGRGVATRVVNERRLRWMIYVALAVVFAILTVLPRPWVARARIVPQDTSASAASTTALLGALGGSAQSIGSLLSGGRASNDLYMVIGRSSSVKQDVIGTLKLVGPDRRFADERSATLWLDKHLDVHLLLGGMMEIETKLHDPKQAEVLTTAYAEAIGRHLSNFGKQLIANKRGVVSRRFADAGVRVAEAESRIAAFRRGNNLLEPEQQLDSALTQRANVEAQIQAKQIEIATQSKFRGPDSPELVALQSDMAGLRAQLARSTAPGGSNPGGPNASRMTDISLRYLDLYRNLRFQQAMYDIYQRSAEQVAVEELATESASYIQVIDPAHVVPERQFNNWAIAALAGVLLWILFFEWYAPATGLFGYYRLEEDGLIEEDR